MSTAIGIHPSMRGCLLSSFAAMVLAVSADAATLRVPADHGTIQAAIDAAGDGDTVLVAPGDYVIAEPIDFNRLHDPGDPASPPVKDIVLRSEGGAEVTAIRMSETPKDPERASVVVFANGETAVSVLEGFTITGGQVRQDSWTVGGGVLCVGSSPRVADCTISENSGTQGGGFSCYRSSPTLTNCTISGNRALEECDSSSLVDTCWGAQGGGVYCGSGSAPILVSCTISENSALAPDHSEAQGGGLYCSEGSSLTLAGCTISGNRALGYTRWSGFGGGLYCARGSSAALTDSTILWNSGYAGGGVCIVEGSLVLASSTVSGNQASEGGALFFQNSSATLTNCIVWGNGSNMGLVGNDALSVSFSCVESQTIWPGEGNINADPLFCGWKGPRDVFVNEASPEGGDGSEGRPFRELAPTLEYSFSLRKDSPCIGAGKGRADMGASHGVCETAGERDRIVHVAAGHYSLSQVTFALGLSLEGVSRVETVLEGTVRGLRSGARLSRVTVTGGGDAGISIGPRQGPTVEDCAIVDSLEDGVFCDEDSSPNLNNCTISGSWGTGVVCLARSSPIMKSCTISGNSDGGVSCFESSPALTDCTILGNSAQSGGGVYCHSSSPTFTNCTISGNRAIATCDPFHAGSCSGGEGGGVFCSWASFPTLSSCTISDNSASGAGSSPAVGGGIYCGGGSSPTLIDCTISGNSASTPTLYSPTGGGVYCGGGSSPTLTRCTISGNSGITGGGVHCDSGSSPILTDCTLLWNRAQRGGGVFSSGSSPTLTSSIVWGNAGGSIVAGDGAVLDVSFSCIEAEAIWPGQGNINADPLFCGWKGPRDMFVDEASPGGGDGTEGSPFHELAPALEYSLSLRRDSPCIGAGKDRANMGAAHGVCETAGERDRVVHVAAGRYSLSGLTFVHGESIQGASRGETVLEGTLWGLRSGARLSHVTVTAGEDGGIVVSPGQSPWIEDCAIAGNGLREGRDLESRWGNWWGGVHCESGSSPVLTGCAISRNAASEHGGGVYCGDGSSPTLVNSTISANSADWALRVPDAWVEPKDYWRGGQGGGVYCSEGSSPTLTNCTISGNWASRVIYSDGFLGGEGGGVYSSAGSSPTLIHCTIAGNADRDDGGSLYCQEDPSATLMNCIVWSDFPGSVCGRLSHCLIDEDPLFVKAGVWEKCDPSSGGDCFPSAWDPQTGEPTAWNRWAFDYHLRPGSPAIDAGTSDGAPPTDIEGRVRPCGAGVDIGAYEFGDCWPSRSFRRGDTNDDAETDISDAIATLGFLFMGNPKELDCQKAADADDSGVLDLSDAVYLLSFQFLGGPAPPQPYPVCGADGTTDGLTCESFVGCM